MIGNSVVYRTCVYMYMNRVNHINQFTIKVNLIMDFVKLRIFQVNLYPCNELNRVLLRFTDKGEVCEPLWFFSQTTFCPKYSRNINFNY